MRTSGPSPKGLIWNGIRTLWSPMPTRGPILAGAMWIPAVTLPAPTFTRGAIPLGKTFRLTFGVTATTSGPREGGLIWRENDGAPTPRVDPTPVIRIALGSTGVPTRGGIESPEGRIDWMEPMSG